MDPLSGSTAFASIVGLIGQFVSGRESRAAHSYDEFRTWLADTRHDDVIRLLEQNGATAIGIKAILAQDRATLLQRFDQLDYQLTIIASLVGGFAELAHAVRPTVQLSRAALTFLRDFDRSGRGQIMEFNVQSGRKLMAIDPQKVVQRAEIAYHDERFFEDDVRQLVDAGLLRVSHAKTGHRIFHFTRQAAELVRSSADWPPN